VVRGESGPGSDLPVPYRNPWGLLAADLRAVGASIVLKVRELWRRNGEADLWRPPFWPRSLAVLFWPALLTGLAAGLVVAMLLLGRLPPASAPAAPESSPQPAAPRPAPAEAPSPADSPSLPATAAVEPEPEPERGAPPPLPIETTTIPPVPEIFPPDPDPLLLSLGEGTIDPLLLSASADPARSELRLVVAAAFAGLSPAARRERAEQWWQRCRELGFEHLDLQDEGGRLLGRTALVGSGMILLESTPTA